jgi:Na+(H+)/acetate symporter ActP
MGTEYTWYKGMYQRNHNKVIGVGAWFSIHASTAPMFLCLGVWVTRINRNSSWFIVGILRKLPVHVLTCMVHIDEPPQVRIWT